MKNEKTEFAREQIQSKYPEFPFPKTSYLVLYSARSGSNLLCKYLAKAGIGNPVEAFNPNTSNRNRLDWGIDYKNPAEYIKTAIIKQSVNNVMGMKLCIPHFRLFIRTAKSLFTDVDLTDQEIVEVFFPETKYIRIQRKDKVKQAISLAKAMQNGNWLVKEDAPPNYRDYIIPAVYDREYIEYCFDKMLMEDVAWNHYLDTKKLPFILVWYEELVSQPEKKINEVYNFLNITGKEIGKAPLRKQSDSKSQDWETRFIKETPWLQEENIKKALDSCDFLSLSIARSQAITYKREQDKYWQMPATKFKWFRKWFFRGKRKLKSIINSSKS